MARLAGGVNEGLERFVDAQTPIYEVVPEVALVHDSVRTGGSQ